MERKQTYIIVDDDILAHKALETLISKYDFMECIGSCYDAFAAVNMLVEKETRFAFFRYRNA
ncbi:MAG: hypothetical protein ACOYLE_06820 [Bacteroidales bacterium]